MASARFLDMKFVHAHTGATLSDLTAKVYVNVPKCEILQLEGNSHRIELPAGPVAHLVVEVSKEGYVPVRMHWQEYSEPLIPEVYTFVLEPGTIIGGVVINEVFQPVAGVVVHVTAMKKGQSPSVVLHDHIETTDAEGRWRCSLVPANLAQVNLLLTHPDYASDIEPRFIKEFSLDELRQETAMLTLKQGVQLSGRVTDEQGKPIEGARIKFGFNRCRPCLPETRTDQEGRYSFPHVLPGETILTITAPGYAPDLKVLDVVDNQSDIDCVLSPGQTVKGRFLDQEGQSINGVCISTSRWRGHSSLDWYTTSDESGYFVWEEAPADPVSFVFHMPGYMMQSNQVLPPQEDIHFITLYPHLQVTGQVTDQKTGKPIPTFQLIHGTAFQDKSPVHWNRREITTFHEGHYDIAFDGPEDRHVIRIEAPGYRPVVSRGVGYHEGKVTLNFELVAAADVVYTVITSEGQPVPRAEVILVTPGERLLIENGQSRARRQKTFETNEQGTFELPPQNTDFTLVVAEDLGYAEITHTTLEQTRKIVLLPWACVMGTLLIGNSPAIQEPIDCHYHEMYSQNTPQIRCILNTTTDSHGRFVLERVPPRPQFLHICHKIPTGQRSGHLARQLPVDILPGTTLEITLGGTGRPIMGCIKPPDDHVHTIDWKYGTHHLELKQPFPTYPDNFMDLTEEERDRWQKTWQEGPEGLAYQRQRRYYAFPIEPDGSFRVEDIPAGTYRLQIQVNEPTEEKGCHVGRGKVLGVLCHEFTVAPMPQGRLDEAMDLGTLELIIPMPLAPGQHAPDFTVETLDYQTVSLAQSRGSYFLLHFWSVQASIEDSDIATLKEIHKTYGQDGRLTMLSIGSTFPQGALVQAVSKHDLPWHHAYNYPTESAYNAYFRYCGFDRKMTLYLIGPDGGIVAKDLKGPALKQAIAKCLT